MSLMSPTMEDCLAAVIANQGTPIRELPGGINTVWALMRRGLVETDMKKVIADRRVYTPAHEHQFIANQHLDGCHWFSSSGACKCGVIHGFRGERSGKADPWSTVWYDETKQCERCRELENGARPVYEVVVQRPSHYVPPLEVVA